MKVKVFAFLFVAITLAGTTLLGINIQLTNTHEPTPDWARLAAQGRDQFLTAQNSQVAKQRAVASYGKLPLSFELNQGQTDAQVKFVSRGSGYSLFLTGPGEAVLALYKAKPKSAPLDSLSSVAKVEAGLATSPAVVRIKLVGTNPMPQVEGLQELPGKSNYFIGNDPKKWRTNVPNYARVKYRDVYPGVDLVYYGNQRELEYDFVVAPGGDPQAIRLGIEGANKVQIDAQGDLVLHTDEGDVRLHKPTVYQEVDGAKQPIAGHYVLRDKRQAGFEIGAYDASRPLVIDPVLSYSTYLGGSGSDNGAGIALDSSGNAYVTGQTGSTNFPTTSGTLQTSFGGGDGFFDGFALDAYIAKLNPTGSALVYSTYLGGSGDDAGLGIAVDSAGSAYVTGLTDSTNFPTTFGAFQTSLAGGIDAFVTKLSAAGSALVYSTYLGGRGPRQCCADEGTSIAVDPAGSAYVAGVTNSTDFPTTPGAFQTTFGGGTFDAFVTKLNPFGTGLLYSTYLGGSGSLDDALDIAVDSTGSAYVAGITDSTNFPTTSGAFQTSSGGSRDAFVTKLNPFGTGLLYSTYLGGSGSDDARGIAVDSTGSAYVAGFTDSTNFPTTSGAFQTSFGGGTSDAFVTKLNAAGSALVYSTYLGGSGNDTGLGIAVGASGSAYVAGATGSMNFPTTPGVFQTTFGGGVEDAFVAKITDFAFLSSGSFVIGDLNATVGNAVTFWGAHWAKVNSLSGGPAPNSFKGFADTAPQTCGGSWTSHPGNSSNPPDSVPPFMAVIASSSITKSGVTISGNVPKIVIVKTNPGYGPSPGHTGTGTVVAVLCGS